MNIFRQWLPIGIVITMLSGAIFCTAQQIDRQNANDPQVALSLELANRLDVLADLGDDEAAKIEVLGPKMIDELTPTYVEISTSLLPYLAIFDDQGNLISSNATLKGEVFHLPSGVFDYTRSHAIDKVTWQPEPAVRQAIVVRRFQGQTTAGFVLAGRSLNEVETRISMLMENVAIGWVAMMVVSFGAVALVNQKRYGHHA